jgi:hypothetical protein
MRNRENFEMAMATFGSFGVMKERERENKESREEVKRPRMTTEGGVVPFSATVGETITPHTKYYLGPLAATIVWSSTKTLQGAGILIIKITSIAIQFKIQKRDTA